MDLDPFTSNADCAPSPGEDQIVKATWSYVRCQNFIQIIQKNRSLGEGGRGGVEIMRANVFCLNEAKRI